MSLVSWLDKSKYTFDLYFKGSLSPSHPCVVAILIKPCVSHFLILSHDNWGPWFSSLVSYICDLLNVNTGHSILKGKGRGILSRLQN